MQPVGDERHQAYIVIHGPGHDGTTLPLREGITSFGRLPSNDVILLGDLVSRHHSRITFFEGRATLQDLGSHNGSWVNGERVSSRVLKEGDVARVGNFRVAFHVGAVQANRSTGYDETTAAEKSSSAPSPPQPSRSVLIREIEQAKSGEAGGARALHLLYRASDALARAVDVNSYMIDILTLALEQIPADLAAYVACEEPSPRVIAAVGPSGELSNPPVSMSVVRWVTSKNFPVTTEDVHSDLRFGGPPSGQHGPSGVMCVPVASERGVLGALYVARSTSERSGGPFADAELDALSAIAHLSVVGIERAEARRSELLRGATKDALARFLSPDVVELLTRHRGPKLEPKTATVLVADIQGLTGSIERVAMDLVTDFLSRYVSDAQEIVHRNKGTIDRIVGSQLVATFGAPFSHGNDAMRGVTAAIEMRAAVDALVKQRPSFANRRLSIGMESGWLLAGLVGTGDRLTYTVAGDPVHAAMRLESSAAPGAILIGEATVSAVQQMFDVKKLGVAQVRGRTEPIRVYEVVGRKQARR
jgi:adenylate cyclase